MRRIAARLLMLVLLCVLPACGSIAQPIWEQAETATFEAAARAANATAIALGLPSPTPVTPTATPLPPTATPTPTLAPSATPTPTQEPATATPTLAPTSTPAMGAQPSSGAVPVGFADAVASGDVAAGLEVFNTPHNMPSGQVWACSQCHSVTPDEARLIGPGLWNISVRGDTRVPGQDALTYVYTSIINPNAFHVVGESEYPVNLMPQGYDEVLTPDELANLVAYLYSLK